MKSKLVSRLSLRAKFRGNNKIEIVVIDHTSNEVFLHTLNFVTGEVATEGAEPDNGKDTVISEVAHPEFEVADADEAEAADPNIEEEDQ